MELSGTAGVGWHQTGAVPVSVRTRSVLLLGQQMVLCMFGRDGREKRASWTGGIPRMFLRVLGVRWAILWPLPIRTEIYVYGNDDFLYSGFILVATCPDIGAAV